MNPIMLRIAGVLQQQGRRPAWLYRQLRPPGRETPGISRPYWAAIRAGERRMPSWLPGQVAALLAVPVEALTADPALVTADDVRDAEPAA